MKNQESMSQCGNENYNHNEASHSQANSRTQTHESSNSYDVYNYANVFFATEKINLPRDKVVEVQSNNSSPSHGFKQDVSPMTQKTNKNVVNIDPSINIGSFDSQQKSTNLQKQR